MILEEFDGKSDPVLTAGHFCEKIENFPSLAVGFFSKDTMQQFCNTYEVEVIAVIDSMAMEYPVYKFKTDNTEIAVFQSPIGAPACVMQCEKIIEMGATSILLAGCAGCLDENLGEYSVVVPTSAIRDEGTSYHYMPVSDEIELDQKFSTDVASILKNFNLPVITGKIWTTDALFRETQNKVNARKSQGAIMVDMECSAITAMCKLKGVPFAEILYGADTLAFDEYDIRTLHNINKSEHQRILDVVIACALKVASKN